MPLLDDLKQKYKDGSNRPSTPGEKRTAFLVFATVTVAWLTGFVAWYWWALAGFVVLAMYAPVRSKHSAEQTHAPSQGAVHTRQIGSVHKPKFSSQPGVVTLPSTFRFSYRDQGGGYATRTVKVYGVSSNEGNAYLEGFCQERLDSRTFRTDRIRGDLTDMATGELMSIRHLLASVRERSAMTFKPKPAATRRRSTHRHEAVLFTGFSAKRRAELEAVAETAGWEVRTTVSATLDYLVAGPRGGPGKIAKADELSVCVVDEDTFLSLVE